MDAERWSDEMASIFRDYVARQLQPLQERIAALEARSFADSMRGGWMAGTRYARGDLAQRRAATWVCLVDDTEERPGDSDHWRQLLR